VSDRLRNILIDLVKDVIPSQVIVCTVKSVDEQKLTCTVTDIVNEIDLFNVRINASLTTKKIAIIPAVNSYVLVGLLNNNKQARYIVAVSEVDKVVVDSNTSIIINGGANGGLCITPKLVEELGKTNDLLQAIVTIISGTPINEPGNGSQSALQAALSGAISGKALGDFSTIENKNVTH